MIRRFVNLVAEDYTTGVRSLHRLNVAKHLFYPSTAQADAANANDNNNNNGDKPPRIPSLRRLPPSTMRFERSPAAAAAADDDDDSDRRWLRRRDDADMFVLLSPRSSESKILHLHTSDDGNAAHIYDADTGSSTAIPGIDQPLGYRRPIFISIAGAGAGTGREEEDYHSRLYVMTSKGSLHESFQVLDLSRRHPRKWEPLPLPPFASSCTIKSFTVVDGSGGGAAICASSETEHGTYCFDTSSREQGTYCFDTSSREQGTYCFDTSSREWRKAGDWALPFRGRAERVPELGVWLGILDNYSYELGACSELVSAMDDAHRAPPTPQHAWKYLDAPPMEQHFTELKGRLRGVLLETTRFWWQPFAADLINLGGGRFCIATTIQDTKTVSFNCENDMVSEQEFLVLSGVEVVRGNDEEEGGGLRMVKHKSKRYKFSNNKIQWVL